MMLEEEDWKANGVYCFVNFWVVIMMLSRVSDFLYRVVLGGMILQLWLLKWKECVL